MNILPKKSWHVRNKDNVAKVKKDEENARIQAKDLSQRAEAADQEAKINYLRKKAKDRLIKNSSDLTDVLQNAIAKPTMSNKSPAVSISSHAKNEDHEREKKEEQMSYEKKLGVLKYLGQDAAETMEESDKPWYFKAPKRPKHSSNDSDEEEADEKDMKRKSSLDPMKAMKVHVQEKRASDKRREKKVEKHKMKKMHKHHREEKERRLETTNDKLAKLRKERLEREKKEKERSRILLGGGDKIETETSQQRYHSQFNPHLARNRSRF